MKPSFFLIGAPKCATTSWASYLSKHPQVALSDPKEPHYFCSDMRSKFHPVIADDAAYETHFTGSPETVIAGEATPLYLYSDEALTRLRDYAPDARIIILLRRQPAFIWSLHQQFLYRRIERIADPYEAWCTSGTRSFAGYDEPELASRLLDYRSLADFERHVGRVMQVFPAEQMLVAWLEDWQRNPSGLWSELCRFLGVEQIAPPQFAAENEAKYHRFPLLSRLTNRPPEVLLRIAGLVRKVLRLERLRFAQWLRALNKNDGYQFPLTAAAEAEVAAFYAAGNARLNQHLKASACLYVPAELAGSTKP